LQMRYSMQNNVAYEQTELQVSALI